VVRVREPVRVRAVPHGEHGGDRAESVRHPRGTDGDCRGYQTEYSSAYFVLFYLGEFVHIFLGGAILSVVFLGGASGPGPESISFIWFVVKVWGFFLFTQWARAAIPRVRIDQLIEIGWKGMLVLSFANLVLTAVIVG